MANPIDLEHEFEELEEKLALTASIRTRLSLIHDFLSDYEKEPLLYESYVHQLAEQIPVIEHPLNIAGADPAELALIYKSLVSLFSYYPVLGEIESFQKAVWSLKNHLCFLYACLGEYNKATRLLIDQPANVSDTADITEWIASIEAYHPSHSLEANWLRRIQNQTSEFESHSVYVPAVERRVGNIQLAGPTGGRLRKLSVALERTTKGKDEIQLNVATFGPEQPVSSYVANPLHAARALVSENAPGIKSHYYRGQVSFRLLYSTHEGSSASLAMAGLFYGGMLEAYEERVIYKLRSGIAATGDMAENGEIIPVDGQTLDQKVEACFYSWLDVLVVPASQLEEAKAAKERLSLQYPRRKLTVLGVNKLQDLFFDRRISKEIRISRIRRAGHKLWMHKVDVVAVLLVMIMAGVIVALVRKPFDKNPAIADFKGEMMIIKNKEGQVLWKKKEWQQTPTWSVGISPLKLTEFYDVNRDGINDIIQLEYESSKDGENYLTCYDGLTHKVLWRLSKKVDLHFPHKPFIGNDSYHSYGMLLDTVSSGPPSLYMIENHIKYFPGILLRIDPLTGSIKNTFVNTGQLYGMGLLDINHNGKKEVIVTGVNNSYNEAVIAVLPHDHFLGRSPSDSMYILPRKSLDSRLGYIRIPMTYLGKSLQNIATYNAGRKIELNEAGLLVKENDTNPGIVDSLMSNAMVLLQFNKTMHLKEVATNNVYDLLSRNLIKKRKIKPIPTPDYFIHFKDSLLYWNGKGWQHKPYMPFWEGYSAGGAVDSAR